MQSLIENILYDFSYWSLSALSFGYFMVLYFGVGALFLFACKRLERVKLLHKIELKPVEKKQTTFEIVHSIKSILIFGFSVIPIIYLVRTDFIVLLPNTWLNIMLGIVLLTLWNEVHFFVVHRLMHFNFFMRHIHFIHHKSRIPTIYSVYSFHWFEALLLSTVPLTILPFIPFSIVAVFIYPFVSILLNFAGHCNYRFGEGKGDRWINFGTAHNAHHTKGRKNYGFALNFLDKLSSRLNR